MDARGVPGKRRIVLKAITCPECGFDLDSTRACRVCGYDPLRDLSHTGAVARGSPMPYIIAGCLAVLIAVLYVKTVLPLSPPPDTSGPSIFMESEASEKPLGDPPTREAQNPVTRPETPSPPYLLKAAESQATGGELPMSSRDAFVKWMLAHSDQKEKYLKARWDRAVSIIQTDGIKNERVLEAFLKTPREYFCRDARRAYESAAMPIGYGQTISGPHLVVRMTDYLNPLPSHKILEIGTGSGYQSALLSQISNRVYTVEIVEPLAEETGRIYARLEDRYPEYRNIQKKTDDGYHGWEQYAPFDRIIVTCGIDHIPPELLKQLAPDGIMVIPVGPPSGQTILKIVKHVEADGSVRLEREDIFQGKRKTIFVPFTAKRGGVHSESDVKDTE
jgi:protein-L-isoaspartate(D-aspartate) O-methyltransferase